MLTSTTCENAPPRGCAIVSLTHWSFLQIDVVRPREHSDDLKMTAARPSLKRFASASAMSIDQYQTSGAARPSCSDSICVLSSHSQVDSDQTWFCIRHVMPLPTLGCVSVCSCLSTQLSQTINQRLILSISGNQISQFAIFALLDLACPVRLTLFHTLEPYLEALALWVLLGVQNLSASVCQLRYSEA